MFSTQGVAGFVAHSKGDQTDIELGPSPQGSGIERGGGTPRRHSSRCPVSLLSPLTLNRPP